MAVYWLLFIVPTLILLSPYRLTAAGQTVAWTSIGVVFAIIIGFRHEVGGDWYTYLGLFRRVAVQPFSGSLALGDPGYYGLSWLVAQLGGDIYVLNLICGLIVMFGVVVFAREQPLPWLALVAAVPYLIVVVAMGYTRQSAALGFALVGFTALGKQRPVNFVVWILLAALFHKSAMLLMPFAALAATRHKLWTWVWVAATTLIGFALLVADESEALWQNYVEADYQAQGGLIRVLMNAVPAAIFLVVHRRLNVPREEHLLWLWLSVFAIACIPLVMMSSAATDRAALYLIPIQMYVFSHALRLAGTDFGRSVIANGIIFYYAAVLFVWLNYAVHAQRWLPYQFMPF